MVGVGECSRHPLDEAAAACVLLEFRAQPGGGLGLGAPCHGVFFLGGLKARVHMDTRGGRRECTLVVLRVEDG